MELFRGTPYEYFAVAPEDALVFTAGACPLDSEGRVVAVGDHQGQARQALANLRAALAEAGSGFDHVLKSTVYVVAAERAELVRTWSVVEEAFGVNAGLWKRARVGVEVEFQKAQPNFPERYLLGENGDRKALMLGAQLAF